MTSSSQPPTDAPGDAGKRKRARRGRMAVERVFIRFVATAGIVGVGVALGAILASSKVQGWIIGLVVALVSVILVGLLSSSRQLGSGPRQSRDR